MTPEQLVAIDDCIHAGTLGAECRELSEALHSLQSKLGDAEKRIDNLCTALESSGKGHAAKDEYARTLESRLNEHEKRESAQQEKLVAAQDRLDASEKENAFSRKWIRELRERIDGLMRGDPPAESADGIRLIALADVCEAYEKGVVEKHEHKWTRMGNELCCACGLTMSIPSE